MEFNEKLQQLRRQNNLTQEQLGGEMFYCLRDCNYLFFCRSEGTIYNSTSIFAFCDEDIFIDEAEQSENHYKPLK